jgi:hypothetical protein
MEFEQLFTLEDALALLPRLRNLMQVIMAAMEEFSAKGNEYKVLDDSKAHGNGYEVKREGLTSRLAELRRAIDENIEAINQLGCQVKDLNLGLVDFPARRANGEIANLCWRMGEETIEYWHTLDTGFMSRRPLSEF